MLTLRRVARILRHLHDRGAEEAGAILVLATVLLTVVLALAGLAIDLTRWTTEAARVQRTADAAALAAAVYLPDDFSGASRAAVAVASHNGYGAATPTSTVSVAPGPRSNQVAVTVRHTVTNLFGGLVGLPRTTLERRALAEYQRPVSMGSADGQFGNDPEAATITTATTPGFWASVAGPATRKVQGDAYLSRSCATGTDNCTSGANAEYDARGYFYGVEVLAGATGMLTIDAFDPAFVQVGGTCGANTNASNLGGAATLTAAQITAYPSSSIAPATRYDPAATSRFCTGDQVYSSNFIAPTTTYRVRRPDDTPWDPSDNPVVCTVSFPGLLGDIRNALLQTNRFPSGAPAYFAQFFRQWYPLCSVPAPTVGTWFVQVTTATNADGSAAPSGEGQNRFSLRARLDGRSSTLVRTFGNGRMSIYTNVAGATATLPLARIAPSAAGRTVELLLFDAGDLTGTGSIQVVPPADATLAGVPLSTFSGCTVTTPPGNATGPPWGTATATASGCTVTGVTSAGYNGQWVSVRIPIPAGYDCASAIPTGCFSTIRYSFSGATSVNDTTTWTAGVRGLPVRLVE